VVNAPLVVGPANNQLTDNSVADLLHARERVGAGLRGERGGVVYTLSREFSGLDHTAASERVEQIEATTAGLLGRAAEAVRRHCMSDGTGPPSTRPGPWPWRRADTIGWTSSEWSIPLDVGAPDFKPTNGV